MRLIYFCFLLALVACNNTSKKNIEQCLSTKKVMYISAKEYHQDFILFGELNKFLDDDSNSESDCFKKYKLVYSLKNSNDKELDVYNKSNEWIIHFKTNNITKNIKILDIKNILGYSVYNDNISLFYSEKDSSVPIKRLVFDNTDFLIYSYEFYFEKNKPLEVIDY